MAVSSHKEESSNTHGDIRKSILDQNKSLSDEIKELKRELHAALEDKNAALEEKKVNRLALADLFTEMALQLGRETSNSNPDA